MRAADRLRAWLAAPDHEAKLARLEKLEWFLERSITLPGWGRKTGADALIGLIPGIGDSIAAALGSYIILEALHAGAPRTIIARMVWNLGVDTVLGAVPVVGDLFDFFYKSNSMNLKLLKRHLESAAGQRPTGVTLSGSRSGAPRASQLM